MSPKFVRPFIPTAGKVIPKGDGWLHELTLDGYRFQIDKDTRTVRLYSRNGYDWTKRPPGFADAFQRLPCRTATLDGVDLGGGRNEKGAAQGGCAAPVPHTSVSSERHRAFGR